jgi:TldD protein
MESSRRNFLKSSGLALGVTALGVGGAELLPDWVLELDAAEAAAVDKEKLAGVALAAAKSAGATYADIRINRYRNEFVSTRERQVQAVARTQSFGFGVRVLVKGAWGFAASNKVNEGEVRRVTQQAIEIAKANAAFQRKAVTLVPAPKATATWKSKIEKDPFDVPIEDKIGFLLKLNEAALKVKGVGFINSSLAFVNEQKFFASSDGSRIEHYIIRSAPQFNVTAVDMARGDVQTRRSLRGPQMMGYEFIEKEPWIAEAEQAGNEAVQKLTAKPVQPGKYDLVLHPTHLWLTIHESAGHSTELDRALSWEADYAGTSFLTPDKLGKFQFGSKLVNILADRTQPAGLATVGYDDDGVQAQTWYLVKEGIFVGWQTTRELAGLIGEKASNGCCHADSWGSVPFARMPNVSLDPGKGKATLDNLIADVKDGILIYGDGSWSIDHQRYNFQFGGQVCWEIKDGKKGAMLRDVAYQSRTPDFWGACDGVGGLSTYELNGALNDGKGEPGQSNAVSHGCPVARFRQINVLNTAVRGRS